MTFNRDEKGQFFKGMTFPDKECHICGTTFTPTSNTAKFCSRPCRLEHRRHVGRERWKCPKYRAKHKAGGLKRKYNITQQEYDTMLENQNNGCKICGKNALDNGRTLPVDHCHKTGEIRGILCDICNRSLGFLEDDIDRILNAAFYLMEAQDE